MYGEMEQATRYSVQERIKIVEVSFCPNSMTISEGLSREKRSNLIHNKAPPGQIQGDGKCTG